MGEGGGRRGDGRNASVDNTMNAPPRIEMGQKNFFAYPPYITTSIIQSMRK